MRKILSVLLAGSLLLLFPGTARASSDTGYESEKENLEKQLGLC